MRLALASVAVFTAVAFAANYFLHFTTDLSLILAICLIGSYGLAGAVAIHGARRIGPESYLGGAFLTIGAGMVCMVIGFVVEDYYKYVAMTDIPYPSFADVFFFLYTPLVILGLWMFLKIHSMRVTRRLVVEALLITAVCLILSFFFLGTLTLGEGVALVDALRGRPADVAEVASESMSVIYLVTDALYVALAALIARVSAGKMSLGLFVFAVGIALMTAGDVAYSVVVENGTYAEGDLSDQLYLAAGLAQAIGLVYIIRPFVSRFVAAQGAATPAPAPVATK